MNKKCAFFALVLLELMVSNGQVLAAEVSGSLSERRKAAMNDAREGHFDVALPALSALTAEVPDDIGIKADYIVVLTWAKKNEEALALAKSINLEKTPSYC